MARQSFVPFVMVKKLEEWHTRYPVDRRGDQDQDENGGLKLESYDVVSGGF